MPAAIWMFCSILGLVSDGIISTIRRTGENGKSVDAATRSPSKCTRRLKVPISVTPRSTSDRVITVTQSTENLRRLNGGASRNSIMLGAVELYSTNVNRAAKMLTSATICGPSTPPVGRMIEGVAISNTTSIARITAPGSLTNTATSPSSRPGPLR